MAIDPIERDRRALSLMRREEKIGTSIQTHYREVRGHARNIAAGPDCSLLNV